VPAPGVGEADQQAAAPAELALLPAAAAVAADPAKAVQAQVCLQGQLLQCAAGLHTDGLSSLLNWVHAEPHMRCLPMTEAVAAAPVQEHRPMHAAAAQGQLDWSIQPRAGMRTHAHQPQVSHSHHERPGWHAQAVVAAAWACSCPASGHRPSGAEARCPQLYAGWAAALLPDWPACQLHGSHPWKQISPCAGARFLL
jgi:hypothetical protein